MTSTNPPTVKKISKENDCSIVSVLKNSDNKTDDNICISDNSIKAIVEKVDHSQHESGESTKTSIIETYKEIRKDYGCENDMCMLEIVESKNILPEAVVEKELAINIKPEGPYDSFKWFNNSNIDEVFHQMEMGYPNYHHINFQMIDFMDLKTELATLDLSKLPKNKNKIGCVLNTDVSTGRGIHWFCVFIDMSKDVISIEFFNSSGNKPKTPVHQWMIKMEEQCNEMGRKCERIIASQNRHQYSDTECGPYSCYYVLSRIQDVPYQFFMKNRIPDEKVTELRKQIFRKD